MGKRNDECVKVVVRCRPMNESETTKSCECVVEMDTKLGQVYLKRTNVNEPGRTYPFDQVYNWDAKQKDIYNETAYPIVNSVMEGYNGTIFAYGQTGTGKTHTMEGKNTPEDRGIIPNSFYHVFDAIQSLSDRKFMVRVSFLEIYNEHVRDLLAKEPKNSLEIKENPDTGVFVKDLTTFCVNCVEEIELVMNSGKKNRATGATLMNQDSSRSHSIFSMTIESCQVGVDQQQHIRVGKLNLVDLAGSERQSKTGATGNTFREATKINLSLTALGNVISALVSGQDHIPYRNSKLTRLLQDSLGGNTKTVMIANIGPADYNYDETASTLRYASSAKDIRNKPRINEDPKDAMIREFQEEINRLRQQLESAATAQPVVEEKIVYQGLTDEQLKELEDAHRNQIDAKTKEMQQEADQKMKQLLESMSTKEKMAEEEKQKLLKEAEKRKEQAEKERKKREEIHRRLKAMEDKLVQGGGAEQVLQQVEQQKTELDRLERKRQEEERARLEAEEQHDREKRELADMLEEKEESFKSLQDEVEQKTKKLKKLYVKFKEVQDQLAVAQMEAQELQEHFWREKEDMLETIRELTVQLKLKNVILDHFVPADELLKIERRAQWNDEAEEWLIARLHLAGNNLRSKRPVSNVHMRRPTTEYARYAAQMDSANPRFKQENIINMGLDVPERTTQDYEGPSMNPHVQAVLDAAFREEEDMTFAASENLPNVYLSYTDQPGVYEEESRSRAPSARPATASRKKTRPASSKPRPGTARKEKKKEPDLPDPDEEFPTARGLV
eukprot:TRINITY_DN4082_c0_g1::TRINITY_DN4082_c0_g1_i1::g.11857::m.11857 TRINITY_DN4082_c0_g1::TRINITY_DN4082_c0_g1_i1::g.11857  ORF type:complete len:795 (+),score=255.95,sp/P46871/KRP95_STRPU/50.96/0.0,Kinesin/PF00225.18/3.6e-119,Kinesin/PF00225.18/3.8e+03,Kinesin/PF00225.18/3.3e+03,PIF1/PF05970.9/0.082,PIF1/PF05970.9/6.8e+03 TRINITY_DN4082_c0_g1_i1:33-2387(+)